MTRAELIDTLWNVNETICQFTGLTDKELIDTLWNVNISVKYRKQNRHNRINRYIMECK